MEDLKSNFLKGLPAHVEALRAAFEALPAQRNETADSVRRIGRSLRGISSVHGFKEVEDAAARLEAAPLDQLRQQTETLLSMLERMSATLLTTKERILVLDDDENLQQLLKEKLSGPNREVLAATSPEVAEKILAEEKISLIILDIILPEMDGRDILLRFRALPGVLHVPIIVVTAKTSYITKAECLALGADDYFEKPFDPEMLSSSVSARIQRPADMSGETPSDIVTGLPGKTSFCEVFRRSSSLCAYIKENLSVALVDLDDFAAINKKYGRAAGDHVLRQAASILAKTARKSDFLARWEADRFTAIFPRTNVESALVTVYRMRQCFENESFRGPGQASFPIAFSAGVVEVEFGISAEDAVHEADRLVYIAKVCGGRRILSNADRLRIIGKKILLAALDPASASTIRHCLQREGFDVLSLDPSAPLLTKVSPDSVGLVILEMMPQPRRAQEFLKDMRKNPSWTGVPVLALVSAADQQDLQQAPGADARLVRPFSPIELLTYVFRLLSVRN